MVAPPEQTQPPQKELALQAFLASHRNLPAQRSAEWLANRRYTIGGSEMGTITNENPYGDIRGLVEGHIGLRTFTGNINTYWGSAIEGLVTRFLERRWGCRIHETGSLPGAIPTQKYSPDGLVYLPSRDKIILLEIKSAARRIADGKVPRMYKPQVYAGLDSIPIADLAVFVDAMFRRCSAQDLAFTPAYDHAIHPDKPTGTPLALALVCFYEPTYSAGYDQLKLAAGVPRDGVVGVGDVCAATLEDVLRGAAEGRLRAYYPRAIVAADGEDAADVHTMYDEFAAHCRANAFEPVAVMPVKLFRLDLVDVERGSWTTAFRGKKQPIQVGSASYVETFRGVIERVVGEIRHLDTLTSAAEKEAELDRLYPPPARGSPRGEVAAISEGMVAYLVESLMA